MEFYIFNKWYILESSLIRKLITHNSSHGVKIKYRDMISEVNHNIPSLNIVFTSRQFQLFESEFDDRFQLVGSSIAARTGDENIPY